MSGWKISADTGGTFTDCLIEGPDSSIRRGKVLSSGCLRTEVAAVLAGNRLEVQPFGYEVDDWICGKPVRIGGHPCGRIRQVNGSQLELDSIPASAASGDILEVDSEWEAPVLALRLLLPDALQPDAGNLSFRLGTTKGTNALLEKKGAPTALFLSSGFADLLLIRDQKRPELFARFIERPAPLYKWVSGVRGRVDTAGRELEALDRGQLRELGAEALARGCEVAAVCFLNSWANPDPEREAEEILRECGFTTVRLSSSIRPLIKYIDRSETTLVDATLSPVMDGYLDRVQAEIGDNPLWVMTSAGGLVSRARFHAVDSLVSGPAGGVLGAVAAGRRAGLERIIGLDMGGTSTDVSRWRDKLELRQQIQVAEARILTPAMPIETVAAGGGSVCGIEDGRLSVGPQSAGADPGPAAYGAGGPLTLTDIHLLLGRIDPAGFSIPIRLDHARKRLDEVLHQAGESDWRALAEGFLKIATERMAHAIRKVTLRDGEDPSAYGLVAFGGAGGLHACRVADELGIRRILYPADAGLLSAKGIHTAPREAVCEKQVFLLMEESGGDLETGFADLQRQATASLLGEGVLAAHLEDPVCSVYIRIAGQETGIPVDWFPGCDLATAFREKFVANFGYFPIAPVLEVVKLRLRLAERMPSGREEVFARASSRDGPFIISDPFATFFVEPGWAAVRGSGGSHQIRRVRDRPASSVPLQESVRRTLVMNRLEGLVEEMGDQLRRTALSTNIRERLDFSCALLDASGRLLVNAPHIPVHLGAMGLCVRECLGRLAIGPGDVVITNHPACGGSHLPDVTLITALHDARGRPLGYLANRAHHAELGGTTPGSMPPDAVSLAEEGVIIEPQYLIRNGQDHFDRIGQLLRNPPYPSRAVRENCIDLEAQLAALQRGRLLFDALLQDFGAPATLDYFAAFYDSAAEALSRSLQQTGPFAGEALEQMDDGHAIKVRISNGGNGLVVDFEGTDPVHPGNLNATPAIVRSAVLYVLRLFVDTPMPLNEGLLDKVQVLLPRCFLNPDFPADPARCPAVVGGNVETSQRVVDALIRALGLMAAGQGTMNNLLFGNGTFGYYETIGGGSGAAEGACGASGVHVHMTNTAITDPEILEQRFPVLCRDFSLRQGSGGTGRFAGGDGLVRELHFLEPVTVSLLTQNRSRGARGLAGGGHGQPGRQWIVRADGALEPLPGIVQLDLRAGEGIRIETPGGGAFGASGA